MDLPSSSTVIDPWNGAGTTTTVASASGLAAFGFDINPVLVIIGKSNLLGADVVESLGALTYEVLDRARQRIAEVAGPTPLDQWFTCGTADYLSSIERSIQGLLVQPGRPLDLTHAESLDQVSSLAASFYVVLFETVRSFLGSYVSSNPTWFKVKADTPKVTLSKDRIDARFRAIERRHHQYLLQLTTDTFDCRAVVKLGDSTAIALADSTADACITSPPYCTRIDYAVLTRPELAVLGVGDDVMRRLRDSGIGTPTIVPKEPERNERWGPYVNAFLDEVKTHSSKASSTYYSKYFVQYFDSMYRSLAELRRVLKADAPCALVVQDSYYKEIHTDLARGLAEMAAGLGWSDANRIDFAVPHRRANMNPASHWYGTKVSATESLLILTGPQTPNEGPIRPLVGHGD